VYVGIVIFFVMAILLVLAFLKTKQRQRRYEERG